MKRQMAASTLVVCLATVAWVTGQTKVTAPKNKYTPAQDVQLGREASAEVRKQLPLLNDGNVEDYVERLGARLAENIPAEFRHNEFRYTFDVVNLREINAFALPGGPMFAHRGMIEKAGSEGEIAGVLAHEISHVALRHGTAQASKAQKYQMGQMGSAILGAIIGGRTGAVVSQAGQFGFGTAFLRFSRDYERAADILGAQMMAQAGYDPRAMAAMFRTIEREGGRGGPEFMSNHPNPGNRSEYITREAESLRVSNPVGNTRDFQNVQARLGQMSPAPTTEEVSRRGNPGGSRGGDTRDEGGRSGPAPTGRVSAPSTRYQTYNEGDIFRVSVPSNWREIASESAVTFAPEGGYGAMNNQNVFTHGVQIGMARSENHGLDEATNELIASLAQANPRLARSGNSTRGTLGGRPALRTILANISDATGGREAIVLYSALRTDGSLFYLVGVSPEEEFRAYQSVFNKVAGSIQFTR